MSTRLYLQNAAIPLGPGSQWGTWDAGWPPTEKKMGLIKLGTLATASRNEATSANPTRRICFRATSDPLPYDVTVEGTVNYCIGAYQSAAGAFARLRFYMYVITPSVGNRGMLVNGAVPGGYLPTSAQGVAGEMGLATVNALAGDRIYMELGFHFANSMQSTYYGYMYYGGTGADQVAGGSASNTSWLEFSTNLFEPPQTSNFFFM